MKQVLLKQEKIRRHPPAKRPPLSCRAINKYNRNRAEIVLSDSGYNASKFLVCTQPQLRKALFAEHRIYEAINKQAGVNQQPNVYPR